MMRRNEKAITKRFGRFINVREHWSHSIKMGESEKSWLDKHKVMTFNQMLSTRPWDECKRNSNACAIGGAR